MRRVGFAMFVSIIFLIILYNIPVCVKAQGNQTAIEETIRSEISRLSSEIDYSLRENLYPLVQKIEWLTYLIAASVGISIVTAAILVAKMRRGSEEVEIPPLQSADTASPASNPTCFQ